jgi:hypothetical protein
MMGADFLEKTKKPFRKHLARSRAKLKMDTLFSAEPELRSRILRAEPFPNCAPAVGDRLTIEPDNGRLIARAGITPVAEISNPPPSLIDHFVKSPTLAPAEVSEINAFCGTLGIKIETIN